MDRGAWWATDHGVAKDSDTTWPLNNMKRINQLNTGRKVDREGSNCGYLNNRTLE